MQEAFLCSYRAGDDGYDAETRLALIGRNTGASLKERPFAELHDAVCVYLKM